MARLKKNGELEEPFVFFLSKEQRILRKRQQKSRKGGFCRKNGLREKIYNSETVLNVTSNLRECALHTALFH